MCRPSPASIPSWWTVRACAAAAVSPVGGEVMFACVDGPEFDAHEVDFDELTARTRAYLGPRKAQAKERT